VQEKDPLLLQDLTIITKGVFRT